MMDSGQSVGPLDLAPPDPEHAPEEIELRVCSVCERTDRYRELPLGPYHFTKDLSRRCDGEVVTVIYRRGPS
jgi:hypothetical protein